LTIISHIIFALLSVFTIVCVVNDNQHRIECVSSVRDCMCARERVCSIFELSEATDTEHVMHKYQLCIFDLLIHNAYSANTPLFTYDWRCDYMFWLFIAHYESKCRYYKEGVERKLFHYLHIRIGVTCTSLVPSQSV